MRETIVRLKMTVAVSMGNSKPCDQTYEKAKTDLEMEVSTIPFVRGTSMDRCIVGYVVRCTKCDQEIKYEDQFCRNCGEPTEPKEETEDERWGAGNVVHELVNNPSYKENLEEILLQYLADNPPLLEEWIAWLRGDDLK